MITGKTLWRPEAKQDHAFIQQEAQIRSPSQGSHWPGCQTPTSGVRTLFCLQRHKVRRLGPWVRSHTIARSQESKTKAKVYSCWLISYYLDKIRGKRIYCVSYFQFMLMWLHSCGLVMRLNIEGRHGGIGMLTLWQLKRRKTE